MQVNAASIAEQPSWKIASTPIVNNDLNMMNFFNSIDVDGSGSDHSYGGHNCIDHIGVGHTCTYAKTTLAITIKSVTVWTSTGMYGPY